MDWMACFSFRAAWMSALSATLTAALTVSCLLLAPAAHAQFRVRTVNNAGTINNITTAENAFLSTTAVISGFSNYSVINFAGTGGGANFAGDNPFPNSLNGTDDFALDAYARLTFNVSGSYVFRVNSDDGFRLRFGVLSDGSGGTTYSENPGTRASGNTDGSALVQTSSGTTNMRLTYFERGGSEEVEFAYSRDGGAFQLVGSTTDITVSPTVGPVSAAEPGTLPIVGMGLVTGAGMALRSRKMVGTIRRRKAKQVT